jgi:hypothetical protein
MFFDTYKFDDEDTFQWLSSIRHFVEK